MLSEDGPGRTDTVSAVVWRDAVSARTLVLTNDNPALFARLELRYNAPQTTGQITLALTTNAWGTARVGVTARGLTLDGGELTFSRAFAVTVNPLNDQPVAFNLVVSGVEDTPVAIGAGGQDVDGDPLTYQLSSPPLQGLVTGPWPEVTYQPGLNYFGPDTFRYTVHDGSTNSAPATVTIHITGVADTTEARLALEPRGGGGLRLLITGEPYQTYVVEGSTDLTNWAQAGTSRAASNGVASLSFTSEAGSVHRFFRGRQSP